MKPIPFKRHRFPADVIRHAVWLYFRFSLSLRDVEELLAQRGIEVSYETARCWTIKFGPLIAMRLKRRRPPPSPRWRLDEMVCWIGGKRMYLWRAVDDEGEVLDLVDQRRRDTEAALKLLRRLLHNRPVEPQTITTDGLASYGAALDQLDLRHLHRPGRLRENNRAENSHLPIRLRERQQQRFKSRGLSPEIPHHPRSDLQRLQHSASLDQQTNPSPLSLRSGFRLGGRGCLNTGGSGISRLGTANLTATADRHPDLPKRG